MSATVVFVDVRAGMQRMGSLAVMDGLATVVEGDIPADILGMKVQIDRDTVLLPTDGDQWLYELSRRFKGYVWAQYVPDLAPDMPVRMTKAEREQQVLFEESEHPRWGPGSPGGKGGEFAPKTPSSLVGGGVHVLSNNAHDLEQALLTGAITNVRPHDTEVKYPGANDVAMAVAEVEGVTTFIKACDQDREAAAYVMNLAMGGLVDMPVTLLRDTPPDLRDNMEYYGHSAPALSVYCSKAEGAPHADPATMNPSQLLDMAVFDAVIGNNDRHGGNVLTEPRKSIHAIDHGLSFQTLIQNQALQHLEARQAGEWWQAPQTTSGGYGHTGGTQPTSYIYEPQKTYRLKAKHVRALKRVKNWLSKGGRQYLESQDLDLGKGNFEGVDGVVQRVNYMLRTGDVLFGGSAFGGGTDYSTEAVDV